MKLKRMLILLGIVLGVIFIFAFNSVNADDRLQAYSLNIEAFQSRSESIRNVTLGISKTRESGIAYTWNYNTIDTANTVWKIKYIPNTETLNDDDDTIADYTNLYYCLNAVQGFEGMAEGNTDDYNKELDMKIDKDDITKYDGGKLKENYNKVLWILDNSYIPTASEDYQNLTEYTNLMDKAEIKIDDIKKCNLTEDDIEVVQQMAIWYFTNSGNTTYSNSDLPFLYINGAQLSSIYIGTDDYGTQITGNSRQEKADKLYKYYINNADANYEVITPSLKLDDTKAKFQKDGDKYIVGPFYLEGNKITSILSETNSGTFTLLDSSKDEVDENNFNNVINQEDGFYLKVESTTVDLTLTYEYNEKTLTFMTDDENYEETQPVVLVQNDKISESISISKTMDLVDITVQKVWDDNNDQDRIRPEKISMQLYADGVVEGEPVELTAGEDNIWQDEEMTYIWNDLPEYDGDSKIQYTVKELDSNSGAIAQTGGEYNDEYSTKYSVVGNITTITNTHTHKEEKKFDLALRKFITEVNGTEVNNLREPEVDTSTITTKGTATYKHTKQPVPVQKGDIVTYTIRVYNEGQVDGYVNKITDHLPDNLIPILQTTVEDKEKYKAEISFNEDWLWAGDEKLIATAITAKDTDSELPNIIKAENETDEESTLKQNNARLLTSAYKEDETIKDDLDYVDVQIKCLVTDEVKNGEYLTNIAEITEIEDVNGVIRNTKESEKDSTAANANSTNLSDYKNGEAINSTKDSYIPGQEDDDDFEKLVVKEFDLALRKFITKVNEKSYSREPKVDASKLGTVDTTTGKTITTANYEHTKAPVIVETQDLVTYTIRVYNEGSLDGYANEITDDIPEGLEFLPNSDINKSNKWKMIDKDGKETENVSEAVMITTNNLSDENVANNIKAVSQDVKENKTLNYKDVQVQFRVIAVVKNLQDNIIKNVAQISEDSGRDIDSEPSRKTKYNYNGINEDDIDYEPIKLQYFDLALRKFITKVNAIDYNNRYPEIEYNQDGKISYKHTKDPVLVETGDTVTYTIRVYNEGEKAGTATEVIDNLPEGLVFIVDNEINKEFGWVLLDAEGNVTEDVTKAIKVKTEYLKDKEIAPLVREANKVLSYYDIKIVFKVTATNDSNKIYTNIAEISADSDDDIDSTPGNNIPEEDDIDKEYVKVEYFDLSLKKWVTETRVIVDDKTTITKTGFTEDSEEIAKVDVVAKKLSKTTVKFAYNIKVVNEGEVPGYAYEVKDYIPSGLIFNSEDNEGWKELEDGIVVTDKLKDTLLNPGESATVEIVLTWKNSSTNLGLKTNYAEISKDSGDDIDSVPDNFNKKEDDIDDAGVILSIKTAGARTYIELTLLTVTILASGIFIIKKYVV